MSPKTQSPLRETAAGKAGIDVSLFELTGIEAKELNSGFTK